MDLYRAGADSTSSFCIVGSCVGGGDVEIERLQRRINALDTKIKKYETQIKEKNNQYQTLQMDSISHKEKAAREQASLRSEIENAEKDLDDCYERIRYVEQENKDLESKIKRHRHTDSESSRSSDIEHMKNTVDELKDKIDLLNVRLAEKTKTEEYLKESMDDLKERAEQAERDNNQLKSGMIYMGKQVERLEDTMESVNANLKKLLPTPNTQKKFAPPSNVNGKKFRSNIYVNRK